MLYLHVKDSPLNVQFTMFLVVRYNISTYDAYSLEKSLVLVNKSKLGLLQPNLKR